MPDEAEHPVGPGDIRSLSGIVRPNLLIQPDQACPETLHPSSNVVGLRLFGDPLAFTTRLDEFLLGPSEPTR